MADHVGGLDPRDRDRVERPDDDHGAENPARVREASSPNAFEDLGVDVEVRVDLVGVVEVLERVDQLHQLGRAVLVERDKGLRTLHHLRLGDFDPRLHERGAHRGQVGRLADDLEDVVVGTMSSAPASSAGIRSSSEYFSPSTITTPFLSNR